MDRLFKVIIDKFDDKPYQFQSMNRQVSCNLSVQIQKGRVKILIRKIWADTLSIFNREEIEAILRDKASKIPENWYCIFVELGKHLQHRLFSHFGVRPDISFEEGFDLYCSYDFYMI